MGIQDKQPQQSLSLPQKMRVVGAIATLTILQPIFVKAQSSKTLQLVCVGITSPNSFQEEASCCRVKSKSKCMTLNQAFSGSEVDNTSRTDKQIPLSDIEFTKPMPVFQPRTSGSESAAKDAVFQMGVTKMLDVIAPNTEGIMSPSQSKTHRKASFFQHARKDFEKIRADYEYVFRPRPMASGAVITPKLNVDFSSLKAGFKIEF